MSLECVPLTDPRSPATATVAVGFGFNCFQFSAHCRGKVVDVLWAAPDFTAGTARPSGSGIPLLFPFPGRIQGGILRWEGREYHLPPGDGRGNAIHGFVLNRPWRVLEQHPNRVVGEFHASRDDASLRELWPTDFLIRACYSLADATLSCRLEIHNPDSRPLPCGLGTHPYFRLPLGGADAAQCVVSLPVSEEWELRELIPTGRRVPLADAAAYQQGKAFGSIQLDNVFTGLTPADGTRHRATLLDPAARIRVDQVWDSALREWGVFLSSLRHFASCSAT